MGATVKGPKDGTLVVAKLASRIFAANNSKKRTALLMMSPRNNEYCTGDYFAALLTAAIQQCEKVTVLIVDDPDAYNYMAETREPYAACLQKARELGDAWWNANQQAFVNCLKMFEFQTGTVNQRITYFNQLAVEKNVGCQVMRWQDWINEPGFDPARFEPLYESNAGLVESLSVSVQDYLKRRNRAVVSSDALNFSKSYARVEAVGVGYLFHRKGFDALIYPGTVLQILKDSMNHFKPASASGADDICCDVVFHRSYDKEQLKAHFKQNLGAVPKDVVEVSDPGVPLFVVRDLAAASAYSIYRDLATELAPSKYSLCEIVLANSFEAGAGTSERRFSKIISSCIKQIKKQHSRGPYNFLVYSYLGDAFVAMLIIGIAEQLKQAGDEVQLMVVDSFSPILLQDFTQEQYADYLLRTGQKILQYFNNFFPEDLVVYLNIDKCNQKSLSKINLRTQQIELLCENIMIPIEHAQHADIETELSRIKQNLLLSVLAPLQKCTVNSVHLYGTADLKAIRDVFFPSQEQYGWGSQDEFSTVTVTYVNGHSNHETILTGQFLSKILPFMLRVISPTNSPRGSRAIAATVADGLTHGVVQELKEIKSFMSKFFQLNVEAKKARRRSLPPEEPNIFDDDDSFIVAGAAESGESDRHVRHRSRSGSLSSSSEPLPLAPPRPISPVSSSAPSSLSSPPDFAAGISGEDEQDKNSKQSILHPHL